MSSRDHMSSSTPSLDGKGGKDSAAKVGKPTKRTCPSYGAPWVHSIPKTRLLAPMAYFNHAVYYRLYTKLGAFELNHPLDTNNDRFVGRIPLIFFAPPDTVASVRRFLCKLEGLSEPDKALVFIPLSSPAPEEDSARLSL